MNINKAFRNNRLMKALTGISTEEFYTLSPIFKILFLDEFSQKTRKRTVGGGRKGILKEIEYKLFFILFYLKVYPTHDIAGFIFGADGCQSCRWVKKFLPILEKTLGRKCCLPKRKIRSMEEFIQAFPEVKDILIDGVERKIQRPKNQKQQRRCYSGKKKAHTRKNTIISDVDRKILVISPTKNGKIHDKKQLDKEGTIDYIPPWTNIWVDKGFQGIHKMAKNGNVIFMPKKKSRGKELSEEQREENKVISSIRMSVEHSIGGVKRFGCLSQKYRNKKGIDDKFIYTCAGLWNFHLMYA